MLFVRAILFTIFMPGIVTVYVPILVLAGKAPVRQWTPADRCRSRRLRRLRTGIHSSRRRHARGILHQASPILHRRGAEKGRPYGAVPALAESDVVSIVTLVLGESLFFESWELLAYAAFLGLMFHLVVVFLEEPHLRERPGYEEYYARVPRWLGSAVRK